MFSIDKRQQKILDKFYKEQTSWSPEHVGNNMLFYLLCGIALLMLLFPAQMWEGERIIPVSAMGLMFMGLHFRMLSYEQYRELDGFKSMDAVLKYFPISAEQIWLYKSRKLLRICLWLCGISLFAQIVFGIGFYHGIGFANILYPVLACLVLPLIFIRGSQLYKVFR